jgi:retron-type reverse transcriptase
MHEAAELLALVLQAGTLEEAYRRLDAILADLDRQLLAAQSIPELFTVYRRILNTQALRRSLVGPPAKEPAHTQAPPPILHWPNRHLPLQSAQEPAHAQAPPPAQALEADRAVRYLGAGVSGRLGDHRVDVERLQRADLPVLFTPADLADQLGLSVSRLGWLAFHTEVATRIHYIHFQAPKRSGGVRTLSKPHRQLDAAQHWVLGRILSRLPVSPACHGFVPGRSIVTNAQQHAGQGLVVTLDLADFFPSIGFPRVRKVFARAGYSGAVSTVLALLCTECPRREVQFHETRYWVATGPRGLPQGACTSPALANQVALRLDRRLLGLAGKLGLRYTRYADDLTFSGPADFATRVGYLLDRAARVALDEGFSLQEKKTRVQRRGARQTVTGLVVNDRPGVVRREVRRLRAILHRARSEGLEAQNREGRPNFRAWLLGKIAYVGMARPEVGAKLRAALEALPG